MDPRVAFMLSDILKEALQRNITRRQLASDITNMGAKLVLQMTPQAHGFQVMHQI